MVPNRPLYIFSPEGQWLGAQNSGRPGLNAGKILVPQWSPTCKQGFHFLSPWAMDDLGLGLVCRRGREMPKETVTQHGVRSSVTGFSH